MKFEINDATIISVADEVNHSEKFSTREFVVSDKQSAYPQFIKLQCANDKCAMLNGMLVGSVIDLKGDIRGRQWTNPQGETQTFNTLNCWSIKSKQVSGNVQQADTAVQTQPLQTPPATTQEDDLPF